MELYSAGTGNGMRADCIFCVLVKVLHRPFEIAPRKRTLKIGVSPG